MATGLRSSYLRNNADKSEDHIDGSGIILFHCASFPVLSLCLSGSESYFGYVLQWIVNGDMRVDNGGTSNSGCDESKFYELWHSPQLWTALISDHVHVFVQSGLRSHICYRYISICLDQNMMHGA